MLRNIFFPYIGNFIIPTDGLLFFRGVGIPPISTSLSYLLYCLVPFQRLRPHSCSLVGENHEFRSILLVIEHGKTPMFHSNHQQESQCSNVRSSSRGPYSIAMLHHQRLVLLVRDEGRILELISIETHKTWLVVWTIFYFSIYLQLWPFISYKY